MLKFKTLLDLIFYDIYLQVYLFTLRLCKRPKYVLCIFIGLNANLTIFPLLKLFEFFVYYCINCITYIECLLNAISR